MVVFSLSFHFSSSNYQGLFGTLSLKKKHFLVFFCLYWLIINELLIVTIDYSPGTGVYHPPSQSHTWNDPGNPGRESQKTGENCLRGAQEGRPSGLY